jgi:hypothetical protein
MSDMALNRRLAEAPVCPSCGRAVVATVTGQCIHCLQAVEGASSVAPASILRLYDLERSRDRVRTAGERRRVRLLVALGIGVAVALVLVGLFGLVMNRAASFFSRGVVAG